MTRFNRIDMLCLAARRQFPFPATGTDPAMSRLIAEATNSLRRFVELAWHVAEPATPFKPGWHIDAVCQHLQAVTDGQIHELIINIPPRHMKSLTVGVFWPAWEWIANPHRKWLFSAYALSLSERDSVKCRRLIESQWYQQHFGDRFQLCGDQNTKLRYENNKAGHRIATSVGGAATGEGGDRVVVDDPHNVIDRQSDAKRGQTLIWWDETMSTRLNDPKAGAKIIVMQRIHEKDLTGHVLAQKGYEHLYLPAEFELSRRCVTTKLNWSDPREKDGDLLWPGRIDKAQIADFKIRLGPESYAGQFQQRPSPAGGALFKKEWFRYFRGTGFQPVSGGSRSTGGPSVSDDVACRIRERDIKKRRDLEDESAESEATFSSSSAGSHEQGSPTRAGRPCHGRESDAAFSSSSTNSQEQSSSTRVGNPCHGQSSSTRVGNPCHEPGPLYVLQSDSGDVRAIRVSDCHRFAVMDPAGSEPGEGRRPCYTVIQVWDVTDRGEMLLVHQYRRQVQAPDAAAAALQICQEFDVAYIAIEKDGIGLGVVQQVKREGVAVRAIKCRGGKESRSQTAEIRMAAGQIYFPVGASFLFELEEELLQFPNGEFCDQVDALSHAAMLVQRISVARNRLMVSPRAVPDELKWDEYGEPLEDE